MKKKIGVVLLAVAIVAGVGIAVVSRNASNNEGPAAGGPPGAMAPRVPVAEVIVRTMTPTVEFTGYLAEGNLVSGGGAGAATLLTTIVSVDPMYVYFDIDEEHQYETI